MYCILELAAYSSKVLIRKYRDLVAALLTKYMKIIDVNIQQKQVENYCKERYQKDLTVTDTGIKNQKAKKWQN